MKDVDPGFAPPDSPPTTRLLEVRIGRVGPLQPDGALSAIRKETVAGPVEIGRLGLHGDEQADRRHHGGEDKAVHHYAAEHYTWWRDRLPDARARLRPGGFGENLSTKGLTEHCVCIGDSYRVGGAVLQVSQARQPCWKLNRVFGRKDMARQVQDSLRTGWYYRVLQPGPVRAGDNIELLERPAPQWPLIRLLQILYRAPVDHDALAAMVQIPTLSESWRAIAARRLATQAVEDWSARLDSPDPGPIGRR